MTVKGKFTVPKKVWGASHLAPGDPVDLDVNSQGQVVLNKAGGQPAARLDRFEAARGKAQVRWRTDDLMALLRGGGKS
jgi:bifunctional DNA-binding transcriptional regulator/antitoxin component of YhaV-PrlF toxin-antitoxin module